MTREKVMFSTISPKDRECVTSKNNTKGKIVEEGKVGKFPSPTIDDVLLVWFKTQLVKHKSVFVIRVVKWL